GVYDNSHWWRPAMPDVQTMPQYWRKNGYHVAGAGKVFHHTAGFNPLDQWDEYLPFNWDDPWDRPVANYPDVPPEKRPAFSPLNGMRPTKHEFDWGSLPKAESDYGDARSVSWAEAFLARKHQKPFFLSLGMFRPHLPWFSPKEDFDASLARPFFPQGDGSDLEDVPAEGKQLAAPGADDFARTRDAGKWEESVTAYRASIRFADRLLGRVLKALERSGQSENTVIVFWSDNGFHLGEKGRFHKSTLWERACHVPMTIAAPGVKPGVCKAPASLLDLYLTMTTLCGLNTPVGMDGESLLPFLQNPGRQAEKPALTNFGPGNYAVSDGRWRYIRYRGGGEELYDLREDPAEWRNLANDAGNRHRMGDMARWIPKSEARPVPGKDMYRFDPSNYSWELRRKAAANQMKPEGVQIDSGMSDRRIETNA
ncbi:MAG: sulfatase-like hydrolase/transferase, partial [Bryobacterales bacterium]|nr:sulfatase-like hydrolase/transferase [Bryobacterales bacterium]